MPGSFQVRLEIAIAETKRDLQSDERLVFINAWNEWQSAYRQAYRRFGHVYFEAVRKSRDAAHLWREAEG